MKKRLYIISGQIILLAVFIINFASCGKDDSGEHTQLSADEAKVEIRAGNQEIMQAMEELMSSPAFITLNFLTMLMDEEFTLKSNLMPILREIEDRQLRAYKEMIIENYALYGEPDPKTGGIWEYNFNTNEFDLINPNVSYLRLIYPADEEDYNAGQRNAELTISDYEYIYDDYEEELPTNLNLELNLHNVLAMSLHYNAIYDAEGIPLSMAIDMEMPPYSLSMSQSETASNLQSHMDFRKNNDILFSYNLQANMTPDNEVETVSGHFQITPLKFEGYMNEADMYNCGEGDIDCMNDNMDINVIHTTLNALIGHLEFRMFTDEWDDTYPELVVVYEDGSWEWLDDIFDLE